MRTPAKQTAPMPTTITDIESRIETVLAAQRFGRPCAAKRGRRLEWPWVPIIDHGEQAIGVHRTLTEQVRGYAYADRDAAVAKAAAVIEARRESLRSNLLLPRMRALREQHGLPREIIPSQLYVVSWRDPLGLWSGTTKPLARADAEAMIARAAEQWPDVPHVMQPAQQAA